MEPHEEQNDRPSTNRQSTLVGTLKNFTAGGVGGVCMVLVGHPFDTIKVRLQTQPKPPVGGRPMFNGTVDCAVKTFRNEGFRGFYRGMIAPLVVVTPIYAISFAGYELGKRLQRNSPDDELTLMQHFNAGMLGGLCTTVVTVPGDRVKCLMQIQQSYGKEAKYSSSIDCARKLFREGGIRSLYKGTGATLLRDVHSGGFYFAPYYFLITALSPAPSEKGQQQKLNPFVVMFAGGLAGMCNWAAAIAPDTIKSRFQTAPEGKYRGVRDVFVELIRTEGFPALFRGIVPVMLRACPGNAVAFLGYELSMQFLNWLIPN